MTVEIQEPKKGRPSEFSIEIMTEICERMAEGKSLREICEKDPDLPARRTIMRWVKNDDSARRLYEAAQEHRMHWYADELINIAYDTSKDTIKGKDGQDICNHEWINRSRLKADTLKFLMAKLAPRTYGEKPVFDGPADNTLTISWQRGPISPPPTPALLTYDPGPLPSRLAPEVMRRFWQAVKDIVPHADQRDPNEVMSQVIDVCERALREEFCQAIDVTDASA
jgi:Bacteriophage Sf6, terminase small subunit-like